MSDAPIRIPVAELVEYLVREQIAHYDKLLVDVVRRLEAQDMPDELRRDLVEDTRAFLAADLERYAQEASEFVARGLRLRDEPVH